MSAAALIAIPTYNERDNLAPLVAAARAALPEADLLIVDDASPDGTGALADQLAAADPRVAVLHRPAKRGLGTAYLDAFRRALAGDYRYVFEMDADFSHDPADLPRLLEAARDGADLAIGSRYVAGGGTVNWGLGRRLLSRGGNLYARAILGAAIQDLTSGYRCYRRAALAAIDLDRVRSEGYAFQIEMAYRAARAGLRVVEVPIRFVDRRVGRSKMSRAVFAEALTAVWRLRLSR